MKYKLILLLTATLAVPATCEASIKFTFLEVGGNVVMNSSGTLETANLVAASHEGWSDDGIGIFGNGGGNFAMIGGVSVGPTDATFRFHDGTDYSAWVGGVPWGTSNAFGWTPTGSKGFATYSVDQSGFYKPGIHLLRADMDGTTWTPDQSWSIAGSFASFSMNPGTYTVTDAVTGESITYQIGPSSSQVPEPASFVLFGSLLAIGAIVARRRFVR